MSNFSKWLGAGIGFAAGGPIGAIIGFVAGTVIDAYSKEDFEQEQRVFKRTYRTSPSQTQSGDFEISLLILAATVIKADGKVDQKRIKLCPIPVCWNVWQRKSQSRISIVQRDYEKANLYATSLHADSSTYATLLTPAITPFPLWDRQIRSACNSKGSRANKKDCRISIHQPE